MGDIVNLKRARKAKVREDRNAAAEANRLRHGRPAAERKLDQARRELSERRLDSHRLEE